MFICNECAAHALRWAGRCARCGAWNSLEAAEQAAGHRARPPPPRLRLLTNVATEPLQRRASGLAELDRVLGGGLVPGSCVLVGGEPGIGKSTLLLAMCGRLQARTLYVAGEESPRQIAMRAQRLGVTADALYVLDTTDTTAIVEAVAKERPVACVVDSVQTLRTRAVEGVPGGPAQVRAAAAHLVPAARAAQTALFLVGHVTKVGGLAGPRYLEHAVDTVVLFEGDRHLSVRALRGVKNRFGATDEIGLFEMRDDGLHEVRHASDLLLADRAQAGPGTVVAAVVEGRRALCVEVQALLVGNKRIPPRRRAQGVDPRRLELLAGVVESRYAPEISDRDLFVNVVGGLSVHDTGLDLAVCAAVLGTQSGAAVDPDAVVVGEVGLRGEVRPVPRLAARLKEAKAMGFPRVFVPRGTPRLKGLALTEVTRVDEVLTIPPAEGSA
ncbi:MAG: DNA repair protein RadA [Planctomycetota bacterium]|jgi:DNA repair protein RadA/Sms